MNRYTYEEQVDMLLVYGFCQGNGRESVRVYSDKYPNRQVPNHQTFGNIERRLRETGHLKKRTVDVGRHRTTRTAAMEEQILERIEENPRISTRRLENELVVPKSIAHRVLREQQLYPYHLNHVQNLLPGDPQLRVNFCRFIQDKQAVDINFCKKILFTDEATFTRSGISNFHNDHVYADENPHALKVTSYQHEFKINIWAGVIGNFIVGPIRLPNRLNGENYLNFLEHTLPNLLEDVPLLLRHEMWLMHDGAPPHFTLPVRNFLHAQYPGRWIGRGEDAPQRWPSRSPDITPCDFFLWGALKSKVYSSPVENEDQLYRRIENAMNSLKNNAQAIQRLHFNFLRRVDLCIQENGNHFEHLL